MLFWEDCRSTNSVINAISNNGGTWRDMSISVLKQLPTQKQRDVEYIKKKDLEPVEVFPNTYEKTITVTEWLPV